MYSCRILFIVQYVYMYIRHVHDKKIKIINDMVDFNIVLYLLWQSMGALQLWINIVYTLNTNNGCMHFTVHKYLEKGLRKIVRS